eukprot:4988185-Ditylum_brightwellii.AAC.1
MALEADVSIRKMKEMPPIPAIDFFCCQFVPNESVSNSAAKMTGRINVVRLIQLQTLIKEHLDQLWNNALR